MIACASLKALRIPKIYVCDQLGESALLQTIKSVSQCFRNYTPEKNKIVKLTEPLLFDLTPTR